MVGVSVIVHQNKTRILFLLFGTCITQVVPSRPNHAIIICKINIFFQPRKVLTTKQGIESTDVAAIPLTLEKGDKEEKHLITVYLPSRKRTVYSAIIVMVMFIYNNNH